MNKETQEKLASSLTAETTDLLPYLPYLLQDFWELGSDPAAMTALISKHVKTSPSTRVLDLACGKGAVSIKIAQELGLSVTGIDLMPEFITFAKDKAAELGVADLCHFRVGDINQAVEEETGWDVVILGAVGDALGNPAQTLAKLKYTVKTGGHILIDEAYLSENAKQEDIGYQNYEYLTESQWHDLFAKSGLELVETASEFESGSDGMEFITKRANELIDKHPHKRGLFEGYIQSQQNEYDDLDHSITGVLWMLKKL